MLLLLLVAGVERRMSQRGKGDGPPPPMGFTDRGPCLQWHFVKGLFFSSALSLSLLLLGKEDKMNLLLHSIAAYLACLIRGWEATLRARRRRELLPYLAPSDQHKMLRNIVCYQISAVRHKALRNNLCWFMRILTSNRLGRV